MLLPCALYAQEAEPANRVNFGLRLPFNIGVRFSGPSGFAAQANPGPATGAGINREYDDGYVRVDGDGNAAGLTWYWGYQNASQLPGDGTLRLHSADVSPSGTLSRTTDDPALGSEISWERRLFTSDRLKAGFTLAFNYSDAEIRDTQSILSGTHVITDVYFLGGIVPPGDVSQGGYQYRGAANVPGPVIGETPMRREFSDQPGGAVTTGYRSPDLSLWGWRLGPWLEFPISKSLSLVAVGGVAGPLRIASFPTPRPPF